MNDLGNEVCPWARHLVCHSSQTQIYEAALIALNGKAIGSEEGCPYKIL